MLVQKTVLGFLAYRVKSATRNEYKFHITDRGHSLFKARVALGAIADDMAPKKTTTGDTPVVIFVGLSMMGPKPLAFPTAQPNRVIPKMGMTTILIMKRYRNLAMLTGQRDSKPIFCHLRDPKQGQLNDVEDKET
jgi:hypothetical protein